jgi:aerobic-type carbon monoxide dehydrogenase small subunit (CoxS/CutS family)
MSEHSVVLEINGQHHVERVPADLLLVDLLRHRLGLTGTKDGCSVGVCGACTVLVDGEPRSACLELVVLLDGCSVRTVEGLSDGDALSDLQEAFIRHGGFQCGICTPGQLMSATALLETVPQPTTGQVREWMMGNLCRCTGYEGIVESVLSASQAGAVAGTPK